MSALLEVRDIKVRYGRGAGALTAVDGVSLSVPAGTTLGLVGESGCGKSSLGRAIVGLSPVTAGRITLDGEDVTDQSRRQTAAYRRRVQMIFQDASAALNPRMTIAEILSEAIRLGRPTAKRRERQARIAELFELVGLPASSGARYTHEFSGGQRQRIAIARALGAEPDLIVTDEITSALDVSVQATILNLLRYLQTELGLAYLFVSHDLSIVRYMSDEVAVMYLGKIMERTPGEKLFERPRHPYTRALMSSIPQISIPDRPTPLPGEIPDPRHPPSGCRFRTRCPIGPLVHADRTICVDVDPTEQAEVRAHRAACHFADEDTVGPPPPEAKPAQSGRS